MERRRRETLSSSLLLWDIILPVSLPCLISGTDHVLLSAGKRLATRQGSDGERINLRVCKNLSYSIWNSIVRPLFSAYLT